MNGKESKIMKLNKIDEFGNYTYFPGVTVIAGVKIEDFSFWQEIYNSVANCKLCRQHYSPLPFKSYHMTTTNLFTKQANGGSNWDRFVRDNLAFFQNLHDSLTASEFSPQITIKGVAISGAIQFVLSLPEDQKILIKRIAKDFGMERGVPDEFHITLAYQYKYLDRTTQEEIKNQLNDRLRDIITAHPINLNAPQLCYFENMTTFTPWNTMGNLKIDHDSRFFAKSGKTSDEEDDSPSNCCIL